MPDTVFAQRNKVELLFFQVIASRGLTTRRDN
jgi:hypothetical protein